MSPPPSFSPRVRIAPTVSKTTELAAVVCTGLVVPVHPQPQRFEDNLQCTMRQLDEDPRVRQVAQAQ